MNKLFLSCALALLAKEKGFDEDCLAYYTKRYAGTNKYPTPIYQHEGAGIGGDKNSDFNDKYFIATAPLYQQIIDWFRDTHCIFITVDAGIAGNLAEYVWGWSLQGAGISKNINIKSLVSEDNSICIKEPNNYLLCYAEMTYEEAREQALEHAFKLI